MNLHHAQRRPDLHAWLREAYHAYLAELVVFGAEYEWDGTTWQPDYLPYWLQERGCHPYVAEREGRLVGFAFAGDRQFAFRNHDTDIKIAEFWVAPSERGRGVARALAEAVFATHPGWYELSVLERNERALRFWRSVIPARIEVEAEGAIELVFRRGGTGGAGTFTEDASG